MIEEDDVLRVGQFDESFARKACEYPGYGFRGRAEDGGKLFFGDVERDGVWFGEVSGEIQQIRREAVRHLFEGEIFDQGGEHGEAFRDGGKHGECDFRIGPDQAEEGFPRQKNQTCLFHAFGMGGKVFSGEYGGFSDGLSWTENVEGLFFSLGGQFIDFHAARDDDEESRGDIAFHKDLGPGRAGAPRGHAGQVLHDTRAKF